MTMKSVRLLLIQSMALFPPLPPELPPPPLLLEQSPL
jgi:hypothetical protein